MAVVDEQADKSCSTLQVYLLEPKPSTWSAR